MIGAGDSALVSSSTLDTTWLLGAGVRPVMPSAGGITTVALLLLVLYVAYEQITFYRYRCNPPSLYPAPACPATHHSAP